MCLELKEKSLASQTKDGFNGVASLPDQLMWLIFCAFLWFLWPEAHWNVACVVIEHNTGTAERTFLSWETDSLIQMCFYDMLVVRKKP